MSVKAGKPVIDVLNEILSGELAAINQYFLHARMCDNWGYKRLNAKIFAESVDEMKHADQLIGRILYLDGLPNVQRIGRIRIGETVPEMFQCDIDLEREAIPRLKTAIALCTDHADHGTRALLESILISEEQHLDWLEEQVSLIKALGETAYLAEQIRL